METGRNSLHRNVKLLWFAPAGAILLIVLLVGLFAFQIIPDLNVFVINRANSFFALPFSVFAVGLSIYAWLHVVYLNFTYELAENEIIIRQGVITRKTTVIPYAMIQDISSERSLMERMFGLATLEIETAGSGHFASEADLPGIANKDALISEMMARVKRAKIAADGARGQQNVESQAILSEILAELKLISHHFKVLDTRPGAAAPPLRNQAAPDAPPAHANSGKKQGFLYESYEKFKKKPGAEPGGLKEEK